VSVVVRVLGIDPGTRSFDVVVVEDGVVVAEESFDTSVVANKPGLLLDYVDSRSVDFIVAPSGYGVPMSWGSDVKSPRRFAVEVLLLSSEEELESGVKSGDMGVWVYRALASVVEELTVKYSSRVVFIPSVILLPTVPWYRKINRVDMGTADKLASTVLAVYNYSLSESVDYDSVDLVLVELGYGYYAVISVSRGKVVDGVGGTVASTGTLTAGALDLEVVAHGAGWDRWDVFRGGVFHYAGVYDLELLARAYERSEEPYASLFKHYAESLAKDVARALVSSPRARVVVLSGRYSRIRLLRDFLEEAVRDVEVREAGALKGARISKESAQGYALIGSGLVGGDFRELVDHVEIPGACGTVVDYLVHPKLLEFKRRVQRAYIESVTSPKLCAEK
jgi:predicted butyrate kinase (DUF1464 family)